MNRLKTLAVALLLSCLALVPLSAQSTVGIYENFDGITTGVPTGWDNSEGTTTIVNYKWASNQNGYSGRGLRFNSKNNQNGRTNFLKTPTVNLSSGLWQVRFMYKNPAGGAFNVYISTDGGATYTTEISNGALPNVSNWTEQTIQLASFLGTNKSNVKIVFKGTSNYNSTENGYLYLDDVYIENVPTCKAPANLAISNVTTTTADISWGLTSVGDVPSQFQITVKNASGTQVYSKTDIAGTSSIFTIPNLQANTTYTATMRSDCSIVGSTDYSKTDSVTFTTACAPQALPYVETYDNLSALSNCGYYQRAQLSNTYSATAGGKSVQLSTGTLSSDFAYIIFPALNVNNNAVECILKVRGSGTATALQLGVVTDLSDVTSTFTPLHTAVVPENDNSWQDVIFNTSTFTPASTPTYIMCYIGSGSYNSVYIDNVDIHAIPTCICPDNFYLVSNTHNTATLAWTSSATSFDVEITTGATVTHQTATSSPFTVTNLQPSTNYSFRVKAVCSASDESRYTMNNVSCHTYCAPVAGTVFSEGAESTTGSDLPSCWLSGYFAPSSSFVDQPFVSQNNEVHSGNRAFALLPQSGTKNAWVSTQGFNVTTAYTHQVNLWVKRDQTPNTMDGLRIYISNAPGDTTGNSFVGFIPLGYSHAPAEAAPGWYDYSFLINYTGVKYITIVGNNSNSLSTIYFDDVAVEPEPTCPAPRSIVVGSPTDTSCPISWTAGGSETQWRLVYTLSKNGTPVESDNVVVSQPNYTFTNLDASSNYTFTADLYALCGPNDSSVVRTQSGSFSTTCVIISNFPYTEDFENDFTSCHHLFNGCSYYYCNATLSRSTTKAHGGSVSLAGPEQPTDNLPALALPMMDFSSSDGYTVKFWMYRDNSNYKSGQWADEGFIIYASSQNVNLTDTTRIGFIPRSMYVAPTEVQAGWYEYSFDIPSSVTGHQYLLFVYRCEYGQAGYLDDITVKLSTGCRNLIATANPSYVSADIIANDPAVTEWEIAYQENDQYATPTVVTAYTDTFTLTGLTSNTQYVYQVRRICPDTTSEWSSPQLFTTLIMPDTLPYISGFEDAADNAKWVLTTEGWSNFYIGTDANAVAEGTHAIYVSYDNSTYGYNLNQQSQAYASRLFHFDALEYNISFRWKCTGGEINADTTSIYDFGRVFLVPGSTELNGGAEWMTYGSFANLWPAGMIALDPDNAPFMALASGDANGWNTISRPVSMSGRDGDYKLVFMWNNESGGAQFPLAIDQISIVPVSCRRPNVGVANLTSTSADIVVSNGIAYQVVVSTTPINVFDSIVTGDIVDTVIATGPVTLTGLTANTSYYYAARSICDSASISEWTTPEQFVTECLAPVPYTESFEVASVIDCWSAADVDRIAISNAQAYDGVRSLRVDSTIAVSPELDIDSMAHYILTGWIYSPVAQNVNVGVVVDPTNTGSYETVTTISVPANSWYEFSTDFTILRDPDYSDFAGARHFAFAVPNSSYSFVDNLYFGTLPGCDRPLNPVITDTVHNGFSMTWSDTNASEWIVAVTPVAGGNTLTAISATQSIDFTGLTEQTQYSVSLAAICAPGDTSLYIPCGVITTPVYVPTCDDPAKAPVVECTTMTTMTVSADDQGIYSVLQFVYGPATMVTSPDQCTASAFTSGNQALLTGLSANLDYNVWYRGVCQPGDTSRWSPMATGRTTYSNFFMPQNPHVVGYPEPTTVIAWGGAPDADKYEYELVGVSPSADVTTDTVTLTGLSYATSYTFRVRAISTTIPDTTAWVTLSFKTISVPASMPYVCDFESQTENNGWYYSTSSQSNHFTIDSINFDGQTTALFVTNDGVTNNYSGTPSTVYATRTMTMMSGVYNVAFDWVCAGEPSVNPGQGNDYPRIFLAPVLMDFTDGTVADGLSYSTLPEGCIALEEGTHLTQRLSKVNHTCQVHVPQSGIYNLVVFWTNDNSLQRDPAITVDNISIYPQQCVAPGASLVATTQTTADIAVVNYSQSTSAIAYSLSFGSRSDAFLTDTMAQPDTIRLTGLTLGTNYNLYVASTCAGEDESLWTLVPFRTDCGTIDIPYTQGFEGLDYFYTPGALNTICWTDLNAGANYADYPNYRAAISGSMVTEGSRSLQLNGGTTRDLYIILPAMTDPTNAQMAFDIAYESTSDCGIVYAGYMTDPADASTFTSVLTTQLNTSFTRLNAIYGAIPTTARLAFRYAVSSEDGKYALIDNIRVSKVVSGDTYNETVCYAQGYTGHGFNISASQLSVGLNTFTRVAPGIIGAPDTVITANITMLNEISTNYYDTICSGVPYSGYGFSIPNPITKAYPRIETAVSGCDSTTYLNLYVIPGTEVIYDTICNGDSYSFHGQTITTAGTYSATYTNPKGCSVSATLHLFVDATSHVTSETICKGTSFTWHGTAYTTAGTYTYHGLTPRQCMVNDTLYLSVLDGDTSYTVQICSGNSYLFIDTVITTAGTYTRTFQDPYTGCTVTHTLTAYEVAAKTQHVYDNACEGKPYSGFGISYLFITQDTVVTINTKAQDMCDSVAYVHLHYTPTVTSEIHHTMNPGDHYDFDGNSLTEAGVYTATFQTSEGCDSVVTLYLALGLETVSDIRIDVVPNPVNVGATALVYGDFGEISTVEVVNSFGQVIDTFTPASYPIEVSGISAAGIYYVRLITLTGDIHIQKLIVR